MGESALAPAREGRVQAQGLIAAFSTQKLSAILCAKQIYIALSHDSSEVVHVAVMLRVAWIFTRGIVLVYLGLELLVCVRVCSNAEEQASQCAGRRVCSRNNGKDPVVDQLLDRGRVLVNLVFVALIRRNVTVSMCPLLNISHLRTYQVMENVFPHGAATDAPNNRFLGVRNQLCHRCRHDGDMGDVDSEPGDVAEERSYPEGQSVYRYQRQKRKGSRPSSFYRGPDTVCVTVPEQLRATTKPIMPCISASITPDLAMCTYAMSHMKSYL